MDAIIGQLIVIIVINCAFFLFLGVVFITNYNTLVKRAEVLKESWGQIEIHLQRRYDALLSMSQVVQGYSSHEQAIDAVVAKARSLMGTGGLGTRVARSADTETMVGGFLGHIMNVTTSFPELKADHHFQTLLETIQQTGNEVAHRRESYNKEVSAFNSFLRKVPAKLYGMYLGFEEEAYFSSNISKHSELPKLHFSQEAVAGGGVVGSSMFPPDNETKSPEDMKRQLLNAPPENDERPDEASQATESDVKGTRNSDTQ